MITNVNQEEWKAISLLLTKNNLQYFPKLGRPKAETVASKPLLKRFIEVVQTAKPVFASKSSILISIGQ
jgi:hypothetical protein